MAAALHKKAVAKSYQVDIFSYSIGLVLLTNQFFPETKTKFYARL